MLLLTKDERTLPDVEEAYQQLRHNDSCTLYEIEEVRLIGVIPLDGLFLMECEQT